MSYCCKVWRLWRTMADFVLCIRKLAFYRVKFKNINVALHYAYMWSSRFHISGSRPMWVKSDNWAQYCEVSIHHIHCLESCSAPRFQSAFQEQRVHAPIARLLRKDTSNDAWTYATPLERAYFCLHVCRECAFVISVDNRGAHSVFTIPVQEHVCRLKHLLKLSYTGEIQKSRNIPYISHTPSVHVFLHFGTTSSPILKNTYGW